jgi:hypothetical protein
VLLFVTVVVPYTIQNQFGLGAGAGLIVSDALLLAGLLWAVLTLAGRPIERRAALAMAAVGVMIAVSALQAVRAWAGGTDLGQIGFELRVLLGWATVAIGVAVLPDREARVRLYRAMLAVGILVGLYGLVQYFAPFALFAEGDAGLREGVRFTSSGKGQIQGGLYAFPVGVLIGFAVLTSGAVRSRPGQAALLVLVITNAVGLLLTYERTFWIATVLGVGMIVLRAGLAQRLRVVGLLLGVVVIAAPALSTVAPGALSAASERLLSLNQYGNDDAVRYRLQEGRHLIDKIEAAPLTGSGLGDELFYGLPWLQTPPHATPYAHNGYLWLSWKIGIPAALLLLAAVIAAVIARPPPVDPLHRAVRLGAQASLLLMLVVNITFPSFSALHITTVLGLLLAICLWAPARERPYSAGRWGSPAS